MPRPTLGLLERPGGLEIAVAASREHLPELSAIKKGQPLPIRRLVPAAPFDAVDRTRH